MMLLMCCTQCISKLGKPSNVTGLEKISFHSNPKKGNAKECSNYHTIALISYASKVLFNILQVSLQQYMNQNFQIFKVGLIYISIQSQIYHKPTIIKRGIDVFELCC